MSERLKLETAIEREVYKFVSMLKEHMSDYTMIYLNRQQINMDREVASRLLEIAKGAIEDGMMSKMDFFKKGIDGALNEYTETQNPLPRGESEKKGKK